VTSDPAILPFDQVVARSDILILCTPHSAYADADLKGKPVVDVWGFLKTRMSSLEHDAAARHRHPGLQRGRLILTTLGELRRQVATPSRILICYDEPEDDTLSTIKANPERVEGLNLEFVRTRRAGRMRR